jgi:hypothetical protein
MDSLGCSSTWEKVNPDDALTAFYCYSVGWLTAQNENVVKIYPHIHDGDEDRGIIMSGVGDMEIPRSAIVRLQVLKEGVSDDES